MFNLIDLIKDPEWKDIIYFPAIEDRLKDLSIAIEAEYNRTTIFPPKEEIFAALNGCSTCKVKCVILGQDPFHGKNQGHGLAFSVKKGIAIPPSFHNIFKELKSDLNIDPPKHGNLQSWLNQGVLLLNSILTVEEGKPGSHKDIGWNLITDRIVEYLGNREQPTVFLLWGAFARSKKLFVDQTKHLILEAAHPSPFSANNGFFGSHPFSKTNTFLKENNIQEIDWKIV